MTPLSAASRAVMAVAASGLNGAQLRARLVEPLRQLTGAGPVFLTSADPVTWLQTGGLPVDVPEGAARQLMLREYAAADVVSFRSLAASAQPVATLYGATTDITSSGRWREVLEPLGWGDEMRAALRDRSGTWGFLCLHRERQDPPFSSEDRAALTGVLPCLAEAFRRTTVAAATESSAHDAPGVVLLDADEQVVATAGSAGDWLEELREDREVPYALVSLSRALQARQAGQRVTVRGTSGRWVTLHASSVDGPGPAVVAIVLDTAHPREVLPLLSAALGLTPRESEVAAAMLRGTSARLIGRQLRMAESTVNVHLRSVFHKAGVSSRGELIARTLSTDPP